MGNWDNSMYQWELTGRKCAVVDESALVPSIQLNFPSHWPLLSHCWKSLLSRPTHIWSWVVSPNWPEGNSNRSCIFITCRICHNHCVYLCKNWQCQSHPASSSLPVWPRQIGIGHWLQSDLLRLPQRIIYNIYLLLIHILLQPTHLAWCRKVHLKQI